MSRVRKVVDPRQVAHLWAHQHQDEARNAGGTFYFTGDTIYSYGRHFPIARFVTSKKQSYLSCPIFFTTRTYSVSTSRHMSYVRNALSQEQWARVIHVENPAANSPREHAKNYQAMADEFRSLVQSAAKQRKNKAGTLAQAIRVRNNAMAYRAAYCKGAMKECKPLPPGDDFAAILTQYAAQDAKSEKRYAARRAKAEAAAKARHDAATLLWDKYLMPAWKLNAKTINVPVNSEAHQLARIVEIACPSVFFGEDESIELKTNPIHHAHPVAFRISEDGQTVQTTKGAEFPVRHCSRVYRVVLACRLAKQWWQTNGRTVRVGHFRVDSIDAEGNVIAGCHSVTFEAIEDLAKRLGLSPEIFNLDHELTRLQAIQEDEEAAV